MKKFFIPFLIFIILFILIDFISYIVIKNNSLKYVEKELKSEITFPSWLSNRLRMYDETTIRWFEENKEENGFREPADVYARNQPSIWLFGCSFVYGTSMKTGTHKFEDTFGYILSSETKRPVYNRAFPSWGVQHMLYQLKKGEIFEELPEPQYVIYTFISDHARRIQKIVYDPWSDGEYLRYKIGKDGKTEKINAFLTPLWKLYIVKLWLGHLEFVRLGQKNHDKNFDLIKKMFEESKDILTARYPDTKFIILLYNGNDGYDDWFLQTERWSELSDEGFIVINAEKLIGKNLRTNEFLDEDNYHPNPYAWKLISEKLANEIIKR